MDGSGLTQIIGGSQGLSTIGGYVGSAIFGNVMLALAIRGHAGIVLKVLAVCMLFASIHWFDNLVTTLALLIFAIGMFALSITPGKNFALSFLGIACVMYIIQDFNVGPSSDLEAYQNEVGIFPAQIWMYIWLGIVILITGINLIYLAKINKNTKN